MELVVHALGYSVEYTRALERPVRAYTHERTVGISAKLTTQQARFTLAHELGHIVIDQAGLADGLAPLAQLVDVPSTPEEWWNRLASETLANAFAGALIMPRSLAFPLINRRGNFPEALCGLFDVSEETAAHRFVALHEAPLHFVRVDSKGIVRKAYSRHQPILPYPAMRLCGYSAACEALKSPDPVVERITTLVDLRGAPVQQVYCRAKRIDDASVDGSREPQTVTVGAALEDARRIWVLDDLPQSAHNTAFADCRGYCPIFSRGDCTRRTHEEFVEFEEELIQQVRSGSAGP